MSNAKSFWCKVFFSEFVMHYACMSKREIAEDVRKSVKALSRLDDSGDSFGSSMVRKANERMASRAASASRENGMNGGRPRNEIEGDASNREEEEETTAVSDSPSVKITPGIIAAISDREGQPTRTEEGTKATIFSPSSKPSSVRNVQLPRNKQEVIEFALDNGFDTDDASTWAEINLKERKGKDKNGKPILNWKGALTNYCKAMADKRRESA